MMIESTMIERELYIKKIRGFIDQPEIIKVITGIRRSGKSVLLQLIQIYQGSCWNHPINYPNVP